jgi:hypothetical protein
LGQLMQLAMSVYYNRDITKRREKDKKTPWPHCSAQRGPHPTGVYILSLLPLWTGGNFCRECTNGGQPGRQPCLSLRPCPLCKGNHWRSKCPHLQMEGGVPPPMDWWVLGPPVLALLLDINVEKPQVTTIEKQRSSSS